MDDHSKKIHAVALVGHGDAGKTTFAEYALLKAGAITRAGSVPEGTTVSDFDADERERGHSIDVSCMHLRWKDNDVVLIDTPGYPDFLGVATYGLHACDIAVFLVSAVSGPGVNTRALWRKAKEMGKARIVAISKMDHENADPAGTLEKLRSRLGEECMPFNLPVGVGKTFSGVVDCVGPDKVAASETSIGDLQEARKEFLEACVECDDELMVKYLEEQPITGEERVAAFRKGLRKGSLAPVVFVSAVQGGGVESLLNLLAEYCPPSSRPVGVEAVDEAGKPVALSGDGPFVASVFKITSDVHVGKLAFLRVWSGNAPPDCNAWSSDKGTIVKLAHPTRPQGKDLTPMKELRAGDVFCVAKIDDLHLGGTVCDPALHVRVKVPEFRPSMVQLAVSPKARGEEHKIGAALHRIEDEDPNFHSERSRETNDLVVSGRSSLHLDVMLKRVTSRFKLDLETALPRVPLKETVTHKAEGHHRHKKQTGGRGQFAEVFLRVAPTERGEGFSFTDRTVGGSIPKNFLPAIEKGIRELLTTGVIAGYPVVDVAVEVYDGKFHDVDSSEAAFKMAGGRAFRDAVEKAGPTLLEPVMHVDIDVPAQYMGEISGDLNTRRGRIQGLEADGDHQIIKALIPLKEMQTYSTDLRSMTAGEGVYGAAFDHLDAVPAHVAKGIIDAFAKTRAHED